MTTARRWNLFVRVLEDILVNHGLQLNDLERVVGVHHEKVRRLKQSLEVPKSFPTLNPEEMKRLQRALSLNDVELGQLKAALLTTAIEEQLMDRIQKDYALAIAEQLQPIIEDLFRVDATGGQGRLVYVEGSQVSMPGLDEALTPLLSIYDHGMLALHLSGQALGYAEQVACLQQAREAFHAAAGGLEQLRGQWGQEAAWQMWLNEVQTALQQVETQLRQLGA